MEQLPLGLAQFLISHGLEKSYADADAVPRFIRVRAGTDNKKPGTDPIDEASVVAQLERHLNVQLVPVPWLPSFYSLPTSTRIATSPAYKQGLVIGMDAASGLCVKALSVGPMDRVLDLCCAPGTKTVYIADIIGVSGTGHVTGVDISAKRMSVCRSLVSRLGVSRARLYVADGTTFNVPAPTLEWTKLDPSVAKAASSPLAVRPPKPFHANGLFLSNYSWPEPDSLYSRVLVDAECTTDGSFAHLRKLATWARENDKEVDLYKDSMRPVPLEDLPKLQLALLRNGFAMCEPGGIVVYSTCSLTREQNEDVVAEFLSTEPNAQLDDIPLEPGTPTSNTNLAAEYPHVDLSKVRRFDATTGTSGLFIARFRKAECQ